MRAPRARASRRNRGGRRRGKNEAVSGSAEKGARGSLCGAGSSAQKSVGRTHGAGERGARQSGDGSNGGQRSRSQGISGSAAGNPSFGGSIGNGNRAPRAADCA